MSRILLDAVYGVNPGMINCFFCNEPKEIALWGKLTNEQKKGLQSAGLKTHLDGEAPRYIVVDRVPCAKCEEYMQQGIILISVREPQTEEEHQNPYRTGGWCVVNEEGIRRAVASPDLLESMLKKRVAFVPDDTWDKLGLPSIAELNAAKGS